RVPEIPMIVSVDDHVVEPPHVWDTWLPEKHRAGAQRIERQGSAGTRHARGVAAVGCARDDMTLSRITYDEMRPGCYEPKARVDDMLMNHVDASLCFPSFPRFCGQTFSEAKDLELGLACVEAYNDWMVDEWCGDSGGALIPLCIIPLWDPGVAAAEGGRNTARGGGGA